MLHNRDFSCVRPRGDFNFGSRQCCLVGLGRSRSLAKGETRVGLQRGRFACGASRASPEPARYQAGEGGPRKKPLHATPDCIASIGRSRPAFRFRRAGASESRGGLSRGGATSGTGRAQRPVGLRVDPGHARFWWFQRPGRRSNPANQESEGGVSARAFARGSVQTTPRPARQPSQARERPCVRSKALSPGRSCQVCEQAGVHPQGDPVTDGRWERSGALCHGRSSEGSVHRLDGQHGRVGSIQLA